MGKLRQREVNCPTWNPGSLAPTFMLLTSSLHCYFANSIEATCLYICIPSAPFPQLLPAPEPSLSSLRIQYSHSGGIMHLFFFRPWKPAPTSLISLHCYCIVWAHIFLLDTQPSRGRLCLSYRLYSQLKT